MYYLACTMYIVQGTVNVVLCTRSYDVRCTNYSTSFCTRTSYKLSGPLSSLIGHGNILYPVACGELVVRYTLWAAAVHLCFALSPLDLSLSLCSRSSFSLDS